MESIANVLKRIDENDAGKYLKHEWQLYGYRLATWLGDMDRVSMYMKFAKNTDRTTLQQAWDFVKDANNPRSKPGLFMWKLSQLKKAKLEEAKNG